MNEQEYSEYRERVNESADRAIIDGLNESAPSGPERVGWLIDCMVMTRNFQMGRSDGGA